MLSGRGRGVSGGGSAWGQAASALPQVSAVGGPGDLMETRVEGNENFRESRGGRKAQGRLEGCFGERLGSHRGFTLGSFLFSLSSSFFSFSWRGSIASFRTLWSDP